MAPCQSNDEIAEVVKDLPDFMSGVRAWVAAVGEPMTWPVWQSGIAKLRLWLPDSAPDPSAEDYSSILSALRDAVMEETHGPSWPREISLAVAARPGSGLEVNEGGSKAAVPAAAVPAAAGVRAEHAALSDGDGGAAVSATRPEPLTAAGLASILASRPQHRRIGSQVSPASAPTMVRTFRGDQGVAL